LTLSPPRLLRPGGITMEQLESVVGIVAVDAAVTRLMDAGEHPRAPGMKYRHYAPKAPVTVVKGDPQQAARYILACLSPSSGVLCFDEFADLFGTQVTFTLGSYQDKAAQARHVFDALRRFDKTAVTEIFAQCPDDGGMGLAVSNRLNKAAGFHIVEV
ncbi:MAG: Sua5 family C-terminal domain-containing protein, partial [Oscillospiraceae bacterium]